MAFPVSSVRYLCLSSAKAKIKLPTLPCANTFYFLQLYCTNPMHNKIQYIKMSVTPTSMHGMSVKRIVLCTCTVNCRKHSYLLYYLIFLSLLLDTQSLLINFDQCTRINFLYRFESLNSVFKLLSSTYKQ